MVKDSTSLKEEIGGAMNNESTKPTICPFTLLPLPTESEPSQVAYIYNDTKTLIECGHACMLKPFVEHYYTVGSRQRNTPLLCPVCQQSQVVAVCDGIWRDRVTTAIAAADKEPEWHFVQCKVGKITFGLSIPKQKPNAFRLGLQKLIGGNLTIQRHICDLFEFDPKTIKVSALKCASVSLFLLLMQLVPNSSSVFKLLLRGKVLYPDKQLSEQEVSDSISMLEGNWTITVMGTRVRDQLKENNDSNILLNNPLTRIAMMPFQFAFTLFSVCLQFVKSIFVLPSALSDRHDRDE